VNRNSKTRIKMELLKIKLILGLEKWWRGFSSKFPQTLMEEAA
jgi:hypothetical protein